MVYNMDYSSIQKQFNEVIEYSQGIHSPKTNDLFARWFEAKKYFIDKMNGKLIYQFPTKVSFQVSDDEKEKRFKSFLQTLQSKYLYPDLLNFLSIQQDGFWSNQVIKPYEYNQITIPKGMKLIKAFKYFIIDDVHLDAIQTMASQIIQSNKVSGTLCFSVHPLDFLSLSENTCNWRSCHSLDGEYRSGNLSYMVDKSTVICYLKEDNDRCLPNFPDNIQWNSKKWRVLLFFSNNYDMLFAGRQYPYSSEEGMLIVKDILLKKLDLGYWSSWNSKRITSMTENEISHNFYSAFVPVEDTLIQLDELVIDQPGSLQFNDVLSSSIYTPIYSYRMEQSLWPTTHLYPSTKMNSRFYVGGKVKCCNCEKDDISLSETFMCNDCELKFGTTDNDMFTNCYICGNRCRVYTDNYIESVDRFVCNDCLCHTVICCNCGDRILEEDAAYDSLADYYFCRFCT